MGIFYIISVRTALSGSQNHAPSRFYMQIPIEAQAPFYFLLQPKWHLLLSGHPHPPCPAIIFLAFPNSNVPYALSGQLPVSCCNSVSQQDSGSPSATWSGIYTRLVSTGSASPTNRQWAKVKLHSLRAGVIASLHIRGSLQNVESQNLASLAFLFMVLLTNR